MPDNYGITTATRGNSKGHVFTRHGKQANGTAFNAANWLGRLAAALEDVAANARPSFPFSPETPHYGPLDEYWSSIRRQYRDLAARAKHDRVGGPFSAEDRILDVSIALEIMYGPIKQKLTHQLATRAERLLGQDTDKRGWISSRVKSFYGVRSAIVHGQKKIKGGRRTIDKALEDGRDLACLTLAELLSRGPVRDWDKLASAGERLPLGV